jgi:hypothetical protein
MRISSFELAVAVSALSGIYVHDQGLLSPNLNDPAADVRRIFSCLGKDDEKAIRMLVAMVTQ